ncbi:hypothetical protein GCM10010149_22450 [Nonomuraea roseoviolacea subsp. roseoviolacea]|uniref:Uncharacterized protein n=1 Tax=Nonomuraea roseoviolacea subsp. carminata TaxID=160689 RepID=A0ABT1JSD7_9ACTN|nr:hypothetical protein [Nonomuraea roseoviolacea]MCP2344668.1 hypothetical protein [Nonomuraea roseoviolacea subsp. carminata]
MSRSTSVAGPPTESVTSGRRWAPHLWWIALALGLAGAVFVWLGTDHSRAIGAAWQLVAKLVVFACLCCAIAFFPSSSRRLHWLLYVPFVFFTGYVIPRISWFYYGDTGRAWPDDFYTHVYLLLYPGIVLTVAAAYRLGGGSPGRCLKVMATGVLIVFSGWLDIMWYTINPVPRPETMDAPHISLITGGPISFGATILFALAHLPIIVGVNLLPLDRWIGRLLGTRP